MGMLILNATLDNIVVASEKLRKGGLVVYPTDTVYGLGCDPFNVEAVKRVFDVKNGRRKPLPILASDIKAVEKIASLSKNARRITMRFWPGPLTIAVRKKQTLSDIVTCNLDSVGVRMPNHDVALQLISLSNGLLVGTSANRTAEKPPITAHEAAKQLGKDVDLILDGGPATLGVSSTVVDLASEKIQILRKGPISFAAIIQVLSQK